MFVAGYTHAKVVLCLLLTPHLLLLLLLLLLFLIPHSSVKACSNAFAKLRSTGAPSEKSLEWKMYRAACKECWQQIIKQARKGKRFSMDRLAVQAHAGWAAIVKHVSTRWCTTNGTVCGRDCVFGRGRHRGWNVFICA